MPRQKKALAKASAFFKEICLPRVKYAFGMFRGGIFIITIKIMDREQKADINIPNEPFKLFVLMLPSYNNGKWDPTVMLAERL